MRLIDADKLKEEYRDDTIFGIACKLIVDSQPTAYGIDKVVEELENMSGVEWHCPDCDYTERDENFIYLPKAIEIVKAGGKDDRD